MLVMIIMIMQVMFVLLCVIFVASLLLDAITRSLVVVITSVRTHCIRGFVYPRA